MRQYISRTITKTTISSEKIEKNEKGVKCTQNPDITVVGTVSEPTAQLFVLRTYGIGSIVTSITEVPTTYRMETEKFMELAEQISGNINKEDLVNE